MNTVAINAFTHAFDPSCTTPNGPTSAVTARPIPVNNTTIPRQNSAACFSDSPRDTPSRFRKKLSVIGIIGKTHGVKIAASPNPNATRRNVARLWSCGGLPELAALPGAAAAGGFDHSVYPAGGVNAEVFTAAGSTLSAAVRVVFFGRHC